MSPTKKVAKLTALPYVLKDDYLSVLIDGKNVAMDSTHPSFNKLKKALKAKDWKEVPKLISLAAKVAVESKGAIKIKDNEVFYKGRVVHSSLTKRMIDMLRAGKSIKHMVTFMDNLYKNPFGEVTINELFDFLQRNNLPITDDGHFMAYKSVNDGYMDAYSGKIDNSVGQYIMMPSKKADLNQRTACSYGFHMCARKYLSGFHNGKNHLMKVKVNPKHVISVPFHEEKVRAVAYEVIGEVDPKEIQKVINITDISEYLEPVVPIAANRQELLKQILGHPTMKRNIKKGKIKADTIKKTSFGKLQAMVKRFELVFAQPKLTKDAKSLDAPLKRLREASGFTIRQVAKELGIDYKAVAKLENTDDVLQSEQDKFIEAIGKLSGIRLTNTSAVTFPKLYEPTKESKRTESSYVEASL